MGTWRGVLFAVGGSVLLAATVALGVWLLLPAAAPRGTPAAEGCLTCHAGVQGMEAAHAAPRVGCSACHLGNARALDAASAHRGMVLVPGNVADMELTCGAAGCHPQVPLRIKNSIMNSMNGVVSVDRWVFGEQPTPTAHTPVDSVAQSPADTHLRNLCVSCHLGTPKTEWGPIGERSRGGGCNACHLVYSARASDELARYRAWKAINNSPSRTAAGAGPAATKEAGGFAFVTHPMLTAQVTDDHCFGCHSRSGRISLNYQGWMETPDKGTRTLEDGRKLDRITADIHAEKGLGCTDCHSSWEVMGEGPYALHQEDQLRVACTDCHLTETPRAMKASAFDAESARIAQRLKLDQPGREHLVTRSNGMPMVNAFLDQGNAVLTTKQGRATLPLKPPARVCTKDAAHKDLSCAACHNAWAPRCVSCHTEYDKDGVMLDLFTGKEAPGEWLEHGNPMTAEPATLGVRVAGNTRQVREFIPGMVMTLSRRDGERPVLKRLYAPTFAHTIRREARSCVSCHASPQALGYGRGKLEFQRNGQWTFLPSEAPLPQDGLPADAWIGFLKERDSSSTTRDNTRPFNTAEQRKILTVGACLTCHAGESAVMQSMLAGPETTIARRNRKCTLPSWK